MSKRDIRNKVIIFIKDFGIIPKDSVGYCFAIDDELDKAFVYLQDKILNMHNFNFDVEALLRHVEIRR